MFTMKESFAAKAQSLSKSQGEDKQTKLPLISERSQHGSLILEAIVVLGMVATFTPLLYKHVADRRADIENINRANTLLYLQQKTEEYLKRPENIKTLVTELGHNEHKEIYPSELGAGDNFDGRYIIGIRREDEDNKPVLKAMIIDAVNTGSDLRAAKVAELIGVSAGIYTAVDPDAAWGINGMWSEPLSRYFTTTNFPTGAVAVTTEYNKEKYRVSISDILVDADLDMGEFNLTAEQINAINLAAQNGTIDQLIAQDINAANRVASPKLVSTDKICFEKEGKEDCIESWEGLGQKTNLQLVQECNADMTESCMTAFLRGLNITCSNVDAVYDEFGEPYPSPKIYNLTYGSGDLYAGKIRVKCEGTNFTVSNISTQDISSPFERAGDSAFGVTESGWYQIVLMGEQGSAAIGNDKKGSGGILIASKQFSKDEVLAIKAIKGAKPTDVIGFGGAGVALVNSVYADASPSLVAGGGTAAGYAGGGYEGGYGSVIQGYSWDGSLGNNKVYCNGSSNCNTANGGAGLVSPEGWGGTGYCESGYICTSIAGGNTSASPQNWSSIIYGNHAAGYASIAYCGTSQSDCPTTCTSDSDCPDTAPFCTNNLCSTQAPPCISDADCPSAAPYCNNNICDTTRSCTSDANCTAFWYPYCVSNQCSNAPYPGTKIHEIKDFVYNYTFSGVRELGKFTLTAPGKYQIKLMGGPGLGNCSASGGILTASKMFAKGDVLTVKGASGHFTFSSGVTYTGGVGMIFWDSDPAKTAPALAAGGGAALGENNSDPKGGGGYWGGNATIKGHPWSSGNSWSGDTSTSTLNQTYCNGKTNCNVAHGGVSFGASQAYAYGGSGYCKSGYSCVAIAGGNSTCSPTPQGYANTRYGNWNWNNISNGGGYASIIYCGPNASSTCPAACGNGAGCSSGSCLYSTGVCQ